MVNRKDMARVFNFHVLQQNANQIFYLYGLHSRNIYTGKSRNLLNTLAKKQINECRQSKTNQTFTFN